MSGSSLRLLPNRITEGVGINIAPKLQVRTYPRTQNLGAKEMTREDPATLDMS